MELRSFYEDVEYPSMVVRPSLVDRNPSTSMVGIFKQPRRGVFSIDPTESVARRRRAVISLQPVATPKTRLRT